MSEERERIFPPPNFYEPQCRHHISTGLKFNNFYINPAEHQCLDSEFLCKYFHISLCRQDIPDSIQKSISRAVLHKTHEVPDALLGNASEVGLI